MKNLLKNKSLLAYCYAMFRGCKDICPNPANPIRPRQSAPNILADKGYLGETALKLRQKTIDKYNCICYIT